MVARCNTDTTYTLTAAANGSDDVDIILTPDTGTADPVKLTAGLNINFTSLQVMDLLSTLLVVVVVVVVQQLLQTLL